MDDCFPKVGSMTWNESKAAEFYIATAETNSGHKIQLSTNETWTFISEFLCGQEYFLSVQAADSVCTSRASPPSKLTSGRCLFPTTKHLIANIHCVEIWGFFKIKMESCAAQCGDYIWSSGPSQDKTKKKKKTRSGRIFSPYNCVFLFFSLIFLFSVLSQSLVRPLMSPVTWTAYRTLLWCHGPAQLGQSSTPPLWNQWTASQRAAGLTERSAVCPMCPAGRTTQWQWLPQTRCVTLTPVQLMYCSQVILKIL